MSRIQTVLGDISPEKLGRTLPHEHMHLNNATLFRVEVPLDAPESLKKLAFDPVKKENFDAISLNPYASIDNMLMWEIDVAEQELLDYKAGGGVSVVDLTPVGTGRDTYILSHLSKKTGVNIVASTGFYIAPSHPEHVKKWSVDEVAEYFRKEIEEGIDPLNVGLDENVTEGIKAGVIGELGMTDPLHPNEEKVLRAGGKAQAMTGVPLTVHVMVFKKEAHLYLNILEEEGANFDKIYLSHMDGSCSDIDYHMSVMDRGVIIDYDLFRNTPSNDSYKLFDGDHWVTDDERVDCIVKLCEQGYEKYLMLSHDACMKTHQKKYGGEGLDYIDRIIIPKLREKGVTEKQIRTMLVDNPTRVLQF